LGFAPQLDAGSPPEKRIRAFCLIDLGMAESYVPVLMSQLRPSKLSKTIALVPPAVALVAQHASGAFDIFIKIGDIKGESVDSKFPEWVVLEACEWGVARNIGSSAGGVDRSSPQLFLNAVGGSPPVPTVTLVLVHPTTKAILYSLTLNDVLVSSQINKASSGDDAPHETVSFNFTKIKFDYNYVDSKGGTTTQSVTYDLEKGVAK
jgi:type VI secretion system secreted protein Hcp